MKNSKFIYSILLLFTILTASFVLYQDSNLYNSKYDITPVVELKKMNVMYLGFENPIQVAMNNINTKNIELRTTNGIINNYGNGHFSVIPNKVFVLKLAVCTLDENNKLDTLGIKEYRVKKVPDPIAKIASISEGEIKKNILNVQKGIYAECVNFDFDIKFKIKSFSFWSNKSDTIISNNYYKFNINILNVFNKLEVGDTVRFYDIKAACSDSIIRELNDIELIIK